MMPATKDKTINAMIMLKAENLFCLISISLVEGATIGGKTSSATLGSWKEWSGSTVII